MAQNDRKIFSHNYSDIFTKVISFLNTSLGTLLIGSVIGILGLFTWQRLDWLFKEQYHRDQVLLDRRIDLVEQINTDIGNYLAHADTIIAAFSKNVPSEQRNKYIDIYNDQQAQWIGVYYAHQSLLGFYFPSTISDKFIEITDSTDELDTQMYKLSKTGRGGSSQEADDAKQKSIDVRELVQEWNNLVLQYLEGDQGR